MADETINCDNAYEAGFAAMKTMPGKIFSDIHLKRKDKVKTLAALTKQASVKDVVIDLNHNQLFHRITCVVRKDEELSEYMKFELSSQPPSLFDNHYMRKGTKSSLVTVFDKLTKPETSVPLQAKFTIDGGYLLHTVIWSRPATFGDICNQYVQYVTQKYGHNCIVVFDGYESSTKDEEHLRRGSKIPSIAVEFGDSTPAVAAKDQFLANVCNKEAFLKLLMKHLAACGIIVHQAIGDADTTIVKQAIQVAVSGTVSVIVGQDTDLIVLMIALTTDAVDVYMLIPGCKDRIDRIYSSRKLLEALGEMKRHILFIHAVTGCDTTSAPYRLGKVAPFNKLKTNFELQKRVAIFSHYNASADEIAAAGEYFIVILYGGSEKDSLDTLRYRKYMRTIAKQSVHATFDLATLPPTSAAARQHSLRVYHQVQQWMDVNLNATDWGWTLVGNSLRPIMTTLEAAPERILHLVSCNCKEGCERNCDCKRGCLPCTSMCGYCAGHGCSNRIVIDDDDDDDDDGNETDEDNQDCETDLETVTERDVKRPKRAQQVILCAIAPSINTTII